MDETAGETALNSNSPASLTADDVTAAGAAIAPILEGSAVVTTNLDSEKNIATLRALAAIDTASAETSSILVKA